MQAPMLHQPTLNRYGTAGPQRVTRMVSELSFLVINPCLGIVNGPNVIFLSQMQISEKEIAFGFPQICSWPSSSREAQFRN